MPPNELPPRPPERYNLHLALGLLAYLAAYLRRKQDSDVLLNAPINLPSQKTQQKPSADHRMITRKLSIQTIGEMYVILEDALINNLGTSDNNLADLMEKKRIRVGKNASSSAWDLLLEFIRHPPQEVINNDITNRAEIIRDKSFAEKFGYSLVLRGTSDTGALLLASSPLDSAAQRPLIYLGQTVRYRKKLKPPTGDHPLSFAQRIQSPGTGPLEGEGRIIHISIPTKRVVPDQIITLLVKDGKGDTKTFLAIDELILES